MRVQGMRGREEEGFACNTFLIVTGNKFTTLIKLSKHFHQFPCIALYSASVFELSHFLFQLWK